MSDKTQQKQSSSLRDVKTLVFMQLKETLSFSFKSDLKQSLVKLALYVIGIAGITAIISLALSILGRLGVLGVGGFLPIPMWNVIFFLLIILNFFSCISRVTDALYFSADNQILLCFPVKANHVFLSKIIVFFINELMRNSFSLLPLLLSFGITYRLAWYFYPWLIVVMLILSLLPVAIASVLSIPTLYIKAFLKRFPWVQSLLLLAVLIVLTVFIFHVMGMIPEELEISKKWSTEYFPAINSGAKAVQSWLYPLTFLSGLAFGYTAGGTENPGFMQVFIPSTPWILLVLIGIIVAFFVLAVFLARPLYFRMASKSFEFAKPSINHHFHMSLAKVGKLENFAIVPTQEIDQATLLGYLKRLSLRHVDVKNTDEVLKLLNGFAGGNAFHIEGIPVMDAPEGSYVYVPEEGRTRLALLESKNPRKFRFYCPEHAVHANISKPSFFSFLLKEIRVDLRSSETIAADYLLFIVTPIAVLILNVIFNAMKKSFDGQMFTILFNALIIALITLASNVSMASVYSREGRANYQLRLSPINYMRTLGSKLFIRAAILTGSLIFAIVIYARNCSLSYVRMDLLFFSFYFLYIGHLLWSAEMDYMNPKVELYAEVGGAISINPNEAKSSALAFILSFLFAYLVFFFVGQSVTDGFYRVLIVSALFLLARIVLFVRKIRAYGMSTYEGRGN